MASHGTRRASGDRERANLRPGIGMPVATAESKHAEARLTAKISTILEQQNARNSVQEWYVLKWGLTWGWYHGATLPTVRKQWPEETLARVPGRAIPNATIDSCAACHDWWHWTGCELWRANRTGMPPTSS